MISTNYFTFGLIICVVAAFGFPEDLIPVAPETDAAANQTCPENEEFSSCGTSCPKTCGTKDLDLFCIALCKEGCFCKPRYVKNDDGICIPTEECPTITCGANETRVFCNSRCPTSYCPANDGPKPLCSQPFPCPSGCACKANYKLNENHQCILATECPPIKCTRPNEVFNSCPQPCVPENCEDLISMSEACKFLEPYCDPKCVCQEGYFRDNTGTCVPQSQCSTPTVAPSTCRHED